MTQPTLTNSTSPAAMCSEEGCTSVAAFSYVWPWGEPGTCCYSHRFHVEQRAQNLGRGSVSFVPIDPNYKPPLTRDERTQLIAARMSVENELADAKARSGALYNENVKATAEARRANAQCAELKAQLADAQADRSRALNERDDALKNLAEAHTSLQRAQATTPDVTGLMADLQKAQDAAKNLAVERDQARAEARELRGRLEALSVQVPQ